MPENIIAVSSINPPLQPVVENKQNPVPSLFKNVNQNLESNSRFKNSKDTSDLIELLMGKTPENNAKAKHFEDTVKNSSLEDLKQLDRLLEYYLRLSPINQNLKNVVNTRIQTLSQGQIDSLFEKVLTSIHSQSKSLDQHADKNYQYWNDGVSNEQAGTWVARAMAPVVKITNPDQAKKTLAFAAYNNLIPLLNQCLAQPGVVVSREAEEALVTALEGRNLDAALLLLQKGVKASYIQTTSTNSSAEVKITERSPLTVLMDDLVYGQTLPENQRAKIIQIIDLMFKNGADGNFIPNNRPNDGIEETSLQRMLKESDVRPEERDFFKNIANSLVKNKVNVPYFLQEILNKNNSSALKPIPGPIQDDLKTIQKYVNFLDKEAKRTHLSPNSVSIEKMDECRTLKKKIKELLGNAKWCAAQSKENFAALQKAYTSITERYDALVEKHELLRELRGVSKEIRVLHKDLNTGKKTEASPRLTKFYHLWNAYRIHQLNPHRNYVVEDCKAGRDFWQGMRKRVIHVSKEYYKDPQWKRINKLWVHGTKSPTLVSMLKSPEKALYPLGILLKKGGVPFSGEISPTQDLWNKTGISGVLCTPKWEKIEPRWLNAATDVLTSVMYARKNYGYHTNEKTFDPNKSWNRLKLESVKDIVIASQKFNPAREDREIGWKIKQNLLVLRVDIMRLRMTDPTADKKLEYLKGYLQQFKNSNPFFRQEYKDLNNALTCPVTHKLTAEDILNVNKPFPVLFGAHYFDSFTNNFDREHILDASNGLQLGKDIQTVFTDPENLVKVKDMMKDQSGVSVASTDMLLMVEMMQMIRGTNAIKDNIKLSGPGTQTQINQIFQTDVLPLYAELFPQKPMFRDDKVEKEVQSPNFEHNTYDEYIKKVQKEEMLPRTTHGAMHATRVGIWSQVLKNVFKEAGLGVVESPIKLAIAAGMHDAAREDEGKDFWDRDSAIKMRQIMERRGMSEQEIQKYYQALAEKDPEEGRFSTIEQQIVHDADCLEIVRCMDPSRFDPYHLCFYRKNVKNRDALVIEAKRFIAMTENFEFKKNLEQNSKEYYFDVLRYMRHVHEKEKCFPTLMHYLRDVMQEVK
jgi:hypothetical protein